MLLVIESGERGDNIFLFKENQSSRDTNLCFQIISLIIITFHRSTGVGVSLPIYEYQLYYLQLCDLGQLFKPLYASVSTSVQWV